MDLRNAELEIATASVLGDISFYASTTQASEMAKLNIRRFGNEGQCKLPSFNNEQCNELVKELNAAIKPVLDRHKALCISQAKDLLNER